MPSADPLLSRTEGLDYAAVFSVHSAGAGAGVATGSDVGAGDTGSVTLPSKPVVPPLGMLEKSATAPVYLASTTVAREAS